MFDDVFNYFNLFYGLLPNVVFSQDEIFLCRSNSQFRPILAYGYLLNYYFLIILKFLRVPIIDFRIPIE